MMDAMCSNPGDWPSLERQSATNGKEIFERQRHLIGSMREQSMVAHADAETCPKPVKEHCGSKQTPIEDEHCRKSPEMEQRHDARDGPVGGLAVRNPRYVRAHGGALDSQLFSTLSEISPGACKTCVISNVKEDCS